MPERSLIRALAQAKCPRCRQGDLFKYPAGNLRRFNVMHKTCPHCGVFLEPEPGFYQGAMYVGYGFTVLFVSIIALLLYISGDWSDWVYMGFVIGAMVLLVPWNYRYSRVVYLYSFGGIKYRPD
jgi:uncharacterized protein (DUF983 family)